MTIDFSFFSTPMSFHRVKFIITFFLWFSLCFRKMNMRRTPTKRVEENDVHEEIPSKVEEVEKFPQGSQGDQVPNVKGGNKVLEVHPELSNREIREALVALAQAVTTQINLIIMPRVNVVERTMTSRLKDFVRMNSPTFVRSKIEEDAQQFLDGVYKVLSSMGVTSREKA